MSVIIQPKSADNPISKKVAKMKVGGSFRVKNESERKYALDAARYFGIKVASRRLGGQFTIIRIV